MTRDGMIRTINVLSLRLPEKITVITQGVSHRSVKWNSRSVVITKRYCITKKANGLVSYGWPLDKDDALHDTCRTVIIFYDIYS